MSEVPSARRATLVATLTAIPSDEELLRLGREADWLEVRADLLGDLAAEGLRAAFPGKLLYTLRSRAEGGASDLSGERRQRRLAEGSRGFDLVDLEFERDLNAELLRAIEPERRVLSWHGGAVPLIGLQARLSHLLATPAALYKLVPAALHAGDALAPLQLLAGAGRRDATAFSTGLAGAWTRLVAPLLGAPVVYAAAGETPGAPGQLSLTRLRRDYFFPELPPIDALFGIVGNPVFHSLSPRLHNGCYRALGLPALYLPFHVDGFGDFWLDVVEGGAFEALGLPLRGLSVTAPHKEAALAVAGAESPLAGRIGAANTLLWNRGVWEAESTDPEGVVLPIRARGVEVRGQNAVVVGTGGAGRSAAVGLAAAGARVTLSNRSAERGRHVAHELGLPFVPLSELDPSGFELLVQATALGRSDDDPFPFDPGSIARGSVVVDLVYRSGRSGRAGDFEPTPLLAAAKARGAIAIDGREVLLSQALGQFRRMTGREMPIDLARELLDMPRLASATDNPREAKA